MTLAWAAMRRSTCVRRAVGCVLVNGLGHVVGTGYNGRPSGLPNCNDIEFHDDFDKKLVTQEERHQHACPGAFAPSGSKPEGCEAVHSEVNALLQCYDTLWVRTAYITRSPCYQTCVRMLMNSGCIRIVFAEESSDCERAGKLWMSGKNMHGVHGLREWVHSAQLVNPFNPV